MAKNKSDFDAQIARARAAGRAALKDPLRAVAALYDARQNTVSFTLLNGTSVVMPVAALEEIRDASKTALSAISLTPGGDALAWEDIDVHISVKGLLHHLFSPALPGAP